MGQPILTFESTAFNRGEEYIFFAQKRIDSGKYYSLYAYQGTFKIDKCIEFLFGSKVNKPFMLVYALVAIIGATLDLGLI